MLLLCTFSGPGNCSTTMNIKTPVKCSANLGVHNASGVFQGLVRAQHKAYPSPVLPPNSTVKETYFHSLKLYLPHTIKRKGLEIY